MTYQSGLKMKNLLDIYNKLDEGEGILDVRTPEEFGEGRVPGSFNIDHQEVFRHAPQLKKYSKLYVYCRAGHRAQVACDTLEHMGLQNLACVSEDGMAAWEENGYPTEK